MFPERRNLIRNVHGLTSHNFELLRAKKININAIYNYLNVAKGTQ